MNKLILENVHVQLLALNPVKPQINRTALKTELDYTNCMSIQLVQNWDFKTNDHILLCYIDKVEKITLKAHFFVTSAQTLKSLELALWGFNILKQHPL